MKKIFLLLSALGCLTYVISCRGGGEDEEKPTPYVKDSLPNPAPTTGHFWWEAQLNMGPRMVMNQKDEIPADSLNIGYTLARMNSYYPDIQVQVIKQYHDTLAVKIPKSQYLTEQMGSSGAQAYLAELTYNLTEVPGIQYVTIIFKAGDHASPDTYERKDFENQ